MSALLARHHVPGASLALIRNGEIAELVAIGVDPQTLFEAASISKVVTAVTVLRLTEQGRLGLDTPVNEMLRSWALPRRRRKIGHAAPAAQPSWRHHGARLPRAMRSAFGCQQLAQILDGAPPANTPAVRVGWPPGKAFVYSGGGTMVLQRLVMDVTGAAFDGLARDLVLAPAGIESQRLLPAAAGRGKRCGSGARPARNNAAWPLPTSIPSMPRQACGARPPTSRAWRSRSRQAGARAGCCSVRRRARWRHGSTTGRPARVPSCSRVDRPPYLYHEGVNARFRSMLVLAADASFGVVLMTNGEGGRPLIPEFLDALFDAHGQEPFRPAD